MNYGSGVLSFQFTFQTYREHPVQEGLERVAMYNMSMLQVKKSCKNKPLSSKICFQIISFPFQSEDVIKAATASMNKEAANPPVFSKL